ncbi:MAG: endonuclease NucS domain-containing protein, partial [Dehalococcoidia bacterium]
PEIKKKLEELALFDGKKWRSAQRRYAKRLQERGLFKPRKATRSAKDYPAIVRMNKEIFDSLGLVWINDRSVVTLTEAGRKFLQSTDPGLPKFVESQLLRYQLPNPAVGKQSPNAGVFPYLAMLSVLSHFPSGISTECYELFIARIRNLDDVERAVERIEQYNALRPKKRTELEEALRSLPIIKDGRIVLKGRRTSLFNTIRLDRSYMLGFLKTPGLIVEELGRLRINRGHHAEAVGLVQHHLREDCIVGFANTEDWIAFYGQLGKRPSHEEALLYHRRRGDVESSERVFLAGRAKKRLPEELSGLRVDAFRRVQMFERNFEDFLILNLEKLERGLRFVQRQYPTPTGPLDILATDAKKRWVVLELKRGRAGDKVVGQLLRYRGFIVSERASGKENRVRGFIVTPVRDRRAIAAVRGAGPLPLEVHQFLVEGRASRLFPS